MSNLEQFGKAFFPEQPSTVSTAYGTVQSVNADGSYQVKLNASGNTRCARLCNAAAGDAVFVVIQENGKCAAVGKVGGEEVGEPLPEVLYDNASGSAAPTLSQSAANFDHMRIFYKKNGDSDACGSVDVFEPNGKNVSLFVVNAYDSSATQFAGRTVSISGTSIASVNKEAYYNVGGGGGGIASSPSVYIYRVEAW